MHEHTDTHTRWQTQNEYAMCLRWDKSWTYIQFPTHTFRKLVHSAQAEHSIIVHFVQRQTRISLRPLASRALASLRALARALSILFCYSCAYFVHQTAVYRPDGKLSNRFDEFFLYFVVVGFLCLSFFDSLWMFVWLFGFRFTKICLSFCRTGEDGMPVSISIELLSIDSFAVFPEYQIN